MRSPADGAEALVGAEASVEVADKEKTSPAATPEPEAKTKVEAEPEAKAPRHPAAGDEAGPPLADAGPYFIGYWSGIPNYGCPYCGFSSLQGNGAVELHILERIDQGNQRHAAALNTK